MPETMTFRNESLVVMPREEYEELMARAGGVMLPAYPRRGKHGWPAASTLRVSIAREIITRRLAAGWTQAELAKRADVRVETISRLEGAKHKPQPATVERIEAVFKKAGV